MPTTGADDAGHAKTVARWLRARRRLLLLLTHVRPDGDAFGSLIGLLRLLQQDSRWECAAYLSNGLPARYRTFFGDDSGLRTHGIQPDAFDGAVCLDTTTWQRVDLPVSMTQPNALLPVCNIDHHMDNSRYGDVCWISQSAATAQMLPRLAEELDLAMTAAAATPLLTGLLTDCGGFRYANTDAAALRDAAALIDAGADYGAITDRLFLAETYERLRLKSELLENATFEFGRQLAYAVLSPAMLQAYGVEPADTENVIDILRIIDGVQIACLLQPEDDGVRLSLRSRSHACAAGDIARALGGGGHPLAAGVWLAGTSVDDAVEKLLNEVKKVLSK